MTIHAHTRPIHTIRWANFRALLADRQLTITRAAELLGKPQGQVSHFGGRVPSKVIGDQIASEIETVFGLTSGALDLNSSGEGGVNSSHPQMRTASQIEPADAAMLAEAEKWVRFEEKGVGQLQPVRRAERLIALFQLIQQDGGVLAPEHAAEIIDAVRKQGVGANGGTAKRGVQ